MRFPKPSRGSTASGIRRPHESEASGAGKQADYRPAARTGQPDRAARLQRNSVAWSAALLYGAAGWDLLGWLRVLPPWWPQVSHAAIGIGIGVQCVALLIRMLRWRPGRTEPHHRARGTGLQLAALGLWLGAWLLRGHPEIPPDPPLVAAGLIAALLLARAVRLHTRDAAASR